MRKNLSDHARPLMASYYYKALCERMFPAIAKRGRSSKEDRYHLAF